jgi:2-polyprenyl-6-methoxyphenol hydroxylase-like FAD-dependent oxidoreductase
LRAALDAGNFLRSTGNTVSWGTLDERVERFAEGERGWQVTRSGFAAQLRAHLTSAGVDVSHARIDPTIVDAARPVFTLDCTGRSGIVARARGLRVHDPSRHTVALTAMWQSAQPFDVHDPTHTLVESYEGGWAWSVPESPHSRVVAVMVDPATSGLARGARAREIYLREIDKTFHVAELVDGATLVEGPSGWDVSMYHATRYVDDNVLLVGDAASFIDPVSSVGIKKALASGWLAAIAVNTSLRRPEMRSVALDFFASHEAEVFESLKTQTDRALAEAATGHSHPFWSDRADAVAATRGDTDVGASDRSESAAYERLRREPALNVRRSPEARTEDRPAISGNEIVLQPRLVSDKSPKGVRYAFNVDLIALCELAPDYQSVPDLLTAYNRKYGPVGMPDFLAALSTALAQKWLVWTSPR